MFRPIDSCKPLVLSQDEEEKDRDTQETIDEKNGDGVGATNNSGSNQSDEATAAADHRRRAKEEEANADSGDRKDVGTEKANGAAKESPEKKKQNIQP